MACSGSVSLEMLYHAKPAVVVYWVNRWMYEILRRFVINVRYITLVNLLATDTLALRTCGSHDVTEPSEEDVPYPEYPTYEDKSEQVAAHIIRWLTEPGKRQRRVDQLVAIRDRYARAGASEQAAEYILGHLGGRPALVPRPHHLPPAAATPATAKARPRAQPM
jgi:lipid-A-disaccharide synthase